MERSIPRIQPPVIVSPPIPDSRTGGSAPQNSATDRPGGQLTGQGKLVFQITTASGAIPLEGAEILLRHTRSASDGNGGEVIAVLYSGGDGKSEVIPLPAPPRSLSLEPAKDGSPIPYALYNADVRMDGFYSQSYIRIPVFDGVTSIQRANLIPLPENGYEGGVRPDGEIFYEGGSPNL